MLSLVFHILSKGKGISPARAIYPTGRRDALYLAQVRGAGREASLAFPGLHACPPRPYSTSTCSTCQNPPVAFRGPFAGDSTVEEQEELLDAAASGGPEMASAVLVVPRQVAADLIERVDPRLAVYIAVGSARDQPSADLLAALSGVTLLRTDERGRVDVVVDGAGMRVGTGR